MKKWIAAVLIAGLMLFNTACTVEHTSTTNVEVEVTQGEAEGVEDGHAMVQYVADGEEDDESFLNFYDGEITYSYFE